MDRVELKTRAKELIKGNKWFIWKPVIFYSLAIFLATFIIMLPFGLAFDAKSTAYVIILSIVSFISGLLETIFMFGYAKYCLDFVRGQKDDWKDTLKFGMKYFVPILLIDLLFALNIIFGYILLIIPGIIATIGLVFVQEVFADNQELGVIETLRKAWNVTNGHKVDLFVLGLSFIGWAILACLTLGILYIWLVPYMIVTFILAYEKLKNN